MTSLQERWVAARSFGGRAPATGEPAEVSTVGDELHVRCGSRTQLVPIAALRMRAVETGRGGIELAWDEEDGVRILQVFDEQGLAALRSSPAFAASKQMQALRAGQQRAKKRRTVGWILILLFLALPALLLLLFIWQADRIAEVAAHRIPIEREIALGAQAFEAMRPTLELQESGAALEAVQTLGQRLAEGSRYSYRFHVAKNPTINAFALPGGIVVVHTGLIESTRRPEELAGVLAHEVQHVERRHSLRGRVKDLGLRGLWLIVTGDVAGVSLSQAAMELTSRKFSRDAEQEADAHGFDTLVDHGIDPSGMTEFFMVMAERSGAALPAFLSTHPADADRQQALRERMDRLGAREFEALQLGPWPPR